MVQLLSLDRVEHNRHTETALLTNTAWLLLPPWLHTHTWLSASALQQCSLPPRISGPPLPPILLVRTLHPFCVTTSPPHPFSVSCTLSRTLSLSLCSKWWLSKHAEGKGCRKDGYPASTCPASRISPASFLLPLHPLHLCPLRFTRQASHFLLLVCRFSVTPDNRLINFYCVHWCLSLGISWLSWSSRRSVRGSRKYRSILPASDSTQSSYQKLTPLKAV